MITSSAFFQKTFNNHDHQTLSHFKNAFQLDRNILKVNKSTFKLNKNALKFNQNASQISITNSNRQNQIPSAEITPWIHIKYEKNVKHQAQINQQSKRIKKYINIYKYDRKINPIQFPKVQGFNKINKFQNHKEFQNHKGQPITIQLLKLNSTKVQHVRYENTFGQIQRYKLKSEKSKIKLFDTAKALDRSLTLSIRHQQRDGNILQRKRKVNHSIVHRSNNQDKNDHNRNNKIQSLTISGNRTRKYNFSINKII